MKDQTAFTDSQWTHRFTVGRTLRCKHCMVCIGCKKRMVDTKEFTMPDDRRCRSCQQMQCSCCTKTKERQAFAKMQWLHRGAANKRAQAKASMAQR